MTYAEYYKAKHEGALIFQDFVVDTVWRLMHIHLIVYGSKAYQFSKGEGPTAEIKHDELFKQTRRLWIEVAEKAAPRGGPYAVSGIYRQDDTWMWAQGDYDTIFLFQKLNLRAIHKSGRYNVIENRTFTSEGFLIPERHATKLAMAVLYPKAGKVLSEITNDLEELGKLLHAAMLKDPNQGELL